MLDGLNLPEDRVGLDLMASGVDVASLPLSNIEQLGERSVRVEPAGGLGESNGGSSAKMSFTSKVSS